MSHPCSTYWTLCLNSPSHGGFNSAVSIGLCVCAEGERWRRYPTSQKVNKPAAQTPQMLTTETVNTLQILSQLRKKDLYARFGGMCRCLYTCDRRKKKKKNRSRHVSERACIYRNPMFAILSLRPVLTLSTLTTSISSTPSLLLHPVSCVLAGRHKSSVWNGNTHVTGVPHMFIFKTFSSL